MVKVIRNLRRRITDRLKKVRGRESKRDPQAGLALLAKMASAEFKLLAELSKLDDADDTDDDDDVRISFAECQVMLPVPGQGAHSTLVR